MRDLRTRRAVGMRPRRELRLRRYPAFRRTTDRPQVRAVAVPFRAICGNPTGSGGETIGAVPDSAGDKAARSLLSTKKNHPGRTPESTAHTRVASQCRFRAPL